MRLSFAEFFADNRTVVDDWLTGIQGQSPETQSAHDVIVLGGTPTPVPTFSLALPLNAPTAVLEGGTVTWTLSLANAVAGQAYAVTLGNQFGNSQGLPPASAADVGPLTVTPGAGVTFDPVTKIVTLAAGTTTATVTQLIATDLDTPEPGETVTLALSSPTNGAVVGGTAPSVITITDVPPENENVVELAGKTAVTAEAGVAEVFLLNFDSTSGKSLSGEAVVTITGFDSAQDILRFNDAKIPPISAADFLNPATGGALIAVTGGFGDPVATNISFFDDPADLAPGAVITLLGISDASLGSLGGDPFFQVV